MIYDGNNYRATCLRVIDGDTVHLEVDLGLRVKRTLDIRLVGINAPEIRGEEREKGHLSREYLDNLLRGETLRVQFHKGKSFDRWLGCIFVEQPEGTLLNVQEDLVKAGHAVEAGR